MAGYRLWGDNVWRGIGTGSVDPTPITPTPPPVPPVPTFPPGTNTHALDNGWLTTDMTKASALYITGTNETSRTSRTRGYREALWGANGNGQNFLTYAGFCNSKAPNAHLSWDVLASTGNAQMTMFMPGHVHAGARLNLAIPILMISSNDTSRTGTPVNHMQLEVALQDTNSIQYKAFKKLADNIVSRSNERGEDPSTWLMARISWEQNGFWYASSPSWNKWNTKGFNDGTLGQRTAAYVQCYRLITSIFKDTIEGVLGAGTRPPVDFNFAGGEGGGSGEVNQAIRDRFPGNDVVDLITVDIYNWYGAKSATDFTNGKKVVDSCASFANEQGLPTGIDECGPGLSASNGYSSSTISDNTVFPTGIADWAQEVIDGITWPNCQGLAHVTWFQTNKTGETSAAVHYFLNDNEGIWYWAPGNGWEASPYLVGDTSLRAPQFPLWKTTVVNRFGTV